MNIQGSLVKRWGVVVLLVGLSFCGLDTVAGEWPEFRGPGGDGRVEGSARLPLRWSETTNVVWKTEIPHVGWSTPVTMDDRIWLSSATKDGP